ncbi:MAG: hypothetical protein QXK37_06535 [Candidatus Woesearchaeota archaeon]
MKTMKIFVMMLILIIGLMIASCASMCQQQQQDDNQDKYQNDNQNVGSQGRCGDKVCDEEEKIVGNSRFCEQDCYPRG